MITNNKYIRGDIGIFDNQISSNIKIEDYEGKKADKYLITKEYLNNQINNIFYPEYIFPIIIRDEDLEGISGDTETEKIENLFYPEPPPDYYYTYFYSCCIYNRNEELKGYFIRQYKETYNENNKTYYKFKNYLMKIILNPNSGSGGISIDIYDEKKELYSGIIYNTLCYSNIINDYNSSIPINLQPFICYNKYSILPIIPIYYSFSLLPLSITQNLNSMISFNYRFEFLNYIGYNYHKNDDGYVRTLFMFNSKLNIFDLKINKNINNIFYSIDLKKIISHNVQDIMIDNIYFNLINLNFLAYDNINGDNVSYRFLNHNQILQSDYNTIKNASLLDNFHLCPKDPSSINLTLTSFSGKLKNSTINKFLIEKTITINSTNITYFSIEYNSNIYNYKLHNDTSYYYLSLLDNDYQEYTNPIKFPYYNSNDKIPNTNFNHIFLCSLNNGNYDNLYYGDYTNSSSSPINFYLLDDEDDLIEHLNEYFINDLSLNVICTFDNNTLNFQLSTPSLSKYMLCDWIPQVYNKTTTSNNNSTQIINKLNYSIPFIGYLKSIEDPVDIGGSPS